MPTIARIKDATRVLGAPPDWDKYSDLPVQGLPIRDVVTQDGVPFMVSAWELTPAEITALHNGETLKIWIQGIVHPVISVSIGDID